jgi:hypothetical protein
MMTRAIRRQRATPALGSRDYLPVKATKTDRGEDFVLHENPDLIILTTKTNLSLLKQSKHWFADGIFKVSYQQVMSLSQ